MTDLELRRANDVFQGEGVLQSSLLREVEVCVVGVMVDSYEHPWAFTQYTEPCT